MSVGPAIGGILAVYSFRWLFLVDGTTSLLAGAVLALAPMRNAGRQKTHEPDWPDATDLGREIEADSVTPLAALHPAADLRAFRNPRMLYFLAALIPVQLVFFQLTSTLPLFLVRYLHFPESVFGTIFTVNTLLIVALEVPLNTAMAHWTHRRTLMLGALLYAVGFGSYALVGMAPFGRTAFVFAAVVIWTFGEMILMPGSSAYAAEIAPPERRGEYMGLYTMSFNIAFAVGPWLGASILGKWGASTVWGTAFVSGCISALMMSRIEQSRAFDGYGSGVIITRRGKQEQERCALCPERRGTQRPLLKQPAKSKQQAAKEPALRRVDATAMRRGRRSRFAGRGRSMWGRTGMRSSNRQRRVDPRF